MSATFITIRFEKLCQQGTGWFGGDRFGMLAPMANATCRRRDTCEHCTIRNVSKEQAVINGMAKTEFD